MTHRTCATALEIFQINYEKKTVKKFIFKLELIQLSDWTFKVKKFQFHKRN